MRLQCDNCQRVLNIPDEKLPNALKFKVRCPQCKHEILIDRNAPAETEESPFIQAARQAKMDPLQGKSVEPDVFPPGAKVAFVSIEDPDWREAARSFFQETGYYESEATSTEEAILKLRLNEYDIVMLEDLPENQPVLAEVAKWSGLKRRSINLILLGEEAQSLDQQIAFARGVNMYLNLRDADRAGLLLDSALRGFELYYRWLYLAQQAENLR